MAILINEFSLWQPGYAGATVRVLVAGTETLASIFTNEALSVAASNPQTLSSLTVGDVTYGKFAAPLYVGVAYTLEINSSDVTGVVRPPITTLAAQDASAATVQVASGTQDIELEDHLARRIDVRDFGAFVIVGGPGASASTNAATIISAIAAASSAGGGFVELPAGTYAFTTIAALPAGVVLRGQGRVATTLQSTTAAAVVTISGARAGLSRLTLDGVTLVGSSIGLYAANKDEIILDDVEIKRFETGISRKGGSRANWSELYISNCVTGYLAYGDLAASAGGALRFNRWNGGKVELCSTAGIDLKYVDQATEHNAVSGVVFDTNTGKAVWVRGVRNTSLEHCRWTGNTNNLTVADISPVTTANTVIGLTMTGGEMSGGTVTLNDNLEAVAFRRMAFTGVTVTLTSPGHGVHVEDCREYTTTISGDITAWRRLKTTDKNECLVTTTDGNAAVVWAMPLEPGQLVFLRTVIIGRQLNAGNYAFYFNAVSVRRPGASLNYELQTVNFTNGDIVTGGTSGATARLQFDVDAGVTGTLTLIDIVGTFVDGEIITGVLGGSATVDGTLTFANAQILTPAALAYDAQTVNFTSSEVITGTTSGATATISADVDGGATGTLTIHRVAGIFLDNEIITGSVGGSATVNGSVIWTLDDVVEQLESNTNWSASWATQSAQAEVRVAGVTGATIEWTVHVEVVSRSRQL